MTSSPLADVPSLSQRIRNDIAEKILSGTWQPGDRIPIEHALTAQYGCARMTVSRAMEALADEGLIVRRRRAGSFVAHPKLESAVLEIPDIQAIVTARNERYSLRLLRQARGGSSQESMEPPFAGTDEVLEVECLHLADDIPFAVEKRMINLRAVPGASQVDFSTVPPGTWLLGHVPWTQAEHRICARQADNATAKLLRMEGDLACLMLERRTWRGDEHITWVRQTFPGTAYHLVARFSPKNAGEI